MPANARTYYSQEYVHGSAARKLDQQRPSVRVLRNPNMLQADALSGSKVIKAVALIVACIFVIACARIFINTATVNVMMENDGVTSNIESVREESSNLEVDLTDATSPTHLKKAAKKLGMAAPYSTETLVLGDDVVAYDEEGNLSLSESLAVAAQE